MDPIPLGDSFLFVASAGRRLLLDVGDRRVRQLVPFGPTLVRSGQLAYRRAHIADHLIHQPLISGNVFGPASDLEITAQEILKTRAKINDMLAAETGQPLERVQRDTQRDYWMDAATAQDYGLIAGIVTHRSDLG